MLLAARAEAHRVAAGLPSRRVLARMLERLEGLAHRNGDGLGWGLASRWDAFKDGTVNPVGTVYSYTTAAAALAFLDGYVVTGDRRYLEIAQAAAKTLLTDTCCWRRGAFLSVWYSDQPADQQPGHLVHNVNAVAAAVLSRLERYRHGAWRAPERDAMAAHILSEQGEGERVPAWSWRYRQGHERPNDLFHEAFMVEGLLADGRPVAVDAARRALAGMWAQPLRRGRHTARRRSHVGQPGLGSAGGTVRVLLVPGFHHTGGEARGTTVRAGARRRNGRQRALAAGARVVRARTGQTSSRRDTPQSRAAAGQGRRPWPALTARPAPRAPPAPTPAASRLRG